MRPLAIFLLLAACGADGAPSRPTAKAAEAEPGLVITGEAKIGIAKEGN